MNAVQPLACRRLRIKYVQLRRVRGETESGWRKLLYSTYLGGSYFNLATAVAVDAAGNAYLTGYTTSSNFPVSSNAFQPVYAGAGGQFDPMFASGDAFVVKMSPTGTIVYSTFLGGSKDDAGWGIAIDAQGDAYIGGSTLSQNFPTLNAFQAAYGGYGGETNPIASASGDIFFIGRRLCWRN